MKMMNVVRQPRFVLKTLFAATLACYVPLAKANPAGGTVVSGSATIQQLGNSLDIHNTPGAIINWQSFSINPNELTRFVQQNSQSAVLNRVMGQDPSQILGQLQSNGRVFLINPNGIVFGQGAQIDVAGLVASSLNISDEDFRTGRLHFQGSNTGSVRNAASITTPTGGFVYLIAPNVENSGVIFSPKGEVLLAAGSSVELVDGVDTSLRVKIDAKAGETLNVGKLIAEQGRIGIFAAAIRQQGMVSATRAEVGEGGKIVFKASRNVELASTSQTLAQGGGAVLVDAGKTAQVDGLVDVTHTQGKGGTAQLLGEQVSLSGRVDASGKTGGGTILLGGDYQGKNPLVRNAQFTDLASGARLDASAQTNGDGGKIIVWADKDTHSAAAIQARAGAQGGNGGFVEVSGKRALAFNSTVDLGAAQGKRGTLFLDPENLLIAATCSVDCLSTLPVNLGDGVSTTSTILASILNTATADISLYASKDITFQTAVNTTQNLLANAGRNLVVNAPLTSTGNITLTAVNNVSASANIITSGLLALTGNRITQGTGVQLGGSGATVKLAVGSGGISQAFNASLLANVLDVSSGGPVDLPSVSSSSGTVAVNATLTGNAGQFFSLASSSDVQLGQFNWAGRADVKLNGKAISQAAGSTLNVDTLNLSTTGVDTAPHGILLTGTANHIKSLSARIDCTSGLCTDVLKVNNQQALEIADLGVTNNGYGDVAIYAHGDILLNSGQVAGKKVSLAADGGIIGYSPSTVSLGTVRGATVDLQRIDPGNGYVNYPGLVGSKPRPLQISGWVVPGDSEPNNGTTLSVGTNLTTGVGDTYIVSSDDAILTNLGLQPNASFFLQSARAIDVGSVGDISTTGDITLNALGLNTSGLSLLFGSGRSLSGRNVLLGSAAAMQGTELKINSTEATEIKASSLSLMGSSPSAMATLSAGTEARLFADSITLGTDTQISAPTVKISTRTVGTGMNLGGGDVAVQLGLDAAELGRITGTNTLEFISSGDMQVDIPVTANILKLTTDQGRITGAGGLNATSSLLLTSRGGVGSSSSPLPVHAPAVTAVSSLDGGGGLFITNSSAGTLMANAVNSDIRYETTSGDLIVLGAHAGSGTVELNAIGGNMISGQAGGVVSSGNMVLTAGGAIGTAAQRFETNTVNSVEVSTGTGDSFLSEQGPATQYKFVTSLGGIDAMVAGSVLLNDHTDMLGTGRLKISSGGDITISGANPLSTGGLALISGGSLTSSRMLQAQGGGVQLEAANAMGTAAARLSVNAPSLQATVHGGGDMYFTTLATKSSNVLNTQGGAIDLMLADDNQVAASSAGGNIKMLAAGPVLLGVVDAASGNVDVTASTIENVSGGKLAGAKATLRAAGSIGSVEPIRLEVGALDADTTAAGAVLQFSGTVGDAKLHTMGGDITLQAISPSNVVADAGTGRVTVNTGGLLTGSFIGSTVKLGSGGGMGTAGSRMQLQTGSADLQAAGDMYVDGSASLTSIKMSNTGAITDFKGATSYSATVNAANSAVALRGPGDIGLAGVIGKSVVVEAAGVIKGPAEVSEHLTANSAELSAGGNIQLVSNVSAVALKSGGSVGLVNKRAITLTSAQVSQNLQVESVGGMTTTGEITAGGAVDLVTHSPMVIGAAINAGRGIHLATTASGNGNDNIIINGPLSTTTGSCDIQSAGGIEQNANITTQGGAINLVANGGSLTMAPGTSSVSNGGAINYAALGSITLGFLDAGVGPISLSAAQGSILSALIGGLNIRAGSLVAVAGGGVSLRATVPSDQLKLISGNGVLDVRDADGVAYPGTLTPDGGNSPISDTVRSINELTELVESGGDSVKDQVRKVLQDAQQQEKNEEKRKKDKKC
ncbi:hypothetical protein CSQ89_14495 [Chitinimonas sp. BJB300]|nr:hypothetical protein CSQ89_14495 [Chitinimonas sp. BJB300]TSJ89971.1 filamentous hemagglutinin N-terminal domain-containing protein [Chitinimonas sp. BJB300]